jgi:hypothetical protein
VRTIGGQKIVQIGLSEVKERRELLTYLDELLTTLWHALPLVDSIERPDFAEEMSKFAGMKFKMIFLSLLDRPERRGWEIRPSTLKTLLVINELARHAGCWVARILDNLRAEYQTDLL